jgi:hypothetical protein
MQARTWFLHTAEARVFQRRWPLAWRIRGRAGRRDSDERPSLGRRSSTSVSSEPLFTSSPHNDNNKAAETSHASVADRLAPIVGFTPEGRGRARRGRCATVSREGSPRPSAAAPATTTAPNLPQPAPWRLLASARYGPPSSSPLLDNNKAAEASHAPTAGRLAPNTRFTPEGSRQLTSFVILWGEKQSRQSPPPVLAPPLACWSESSSAFCGGGRCFRGYGDPPRR